MRTLSSEGGEPALLALMKDLVDALGTLVAGHIRLARAELGDDARRYARRAAALAVGAALGLVGYGLACVAAALALVQVAGWSSSSGARRPSPSTNHARPSIGRWPRSP